MAIAFRTALALERPCPTMVTLATPSSGAPPYSELHRHDLVSLDDAHAACVDVGVPRELGREDRRRTDEQHAQIEMAHRRERPVDDVARGVVTAHGIDCDVDHAVPGFRVQGSGFRVQGSVARRTANLEP